MPLLEDNTEAFIVRIWLERRDSREDPLVWRGKVEHVGNEQVCYVKDYFDIIDFIRRQLNAVAQSAANEP